MLRPNEMIVGGCRDLYCDGTICWKSYKSAVMAMRSRMEERLLVPQRFSGMEGSGDADHRQERMSALVSMQKPSDAGLFCAKSVP